MHQLTVIFLKREKKKRTNVLKSFVSSQCFLFFVFVTKLKQKNDYGTFKEWLPSQFFANSAAIFSLAASYRGLPSRLSTLSLTFSSVTATFLLFLPLPSQLHFQCPLSTRSTFLLHMSKLFQPFLSNFVLCDP